MVKSLCTGMVPTVCSRKHLTRIVDHWDRGDRSRNCRGAERINVRSFSRLMCMMQTDKQQCRLILLLLWHADDTKPLLDWRASAVTRGYVVPDRKLSLVASLAGRMVHHALVLYELRKRWRLPVQWLPVPTQGELI